MGDGWDTKEKIFRNTFNAFTPSSSLQVGYQELDSQLFAFDEYLGRFNLSLLGACLFWSDRSNGDDSTGYYFVSNSSYFFLSFRLNIIF